MPSQALPCRTVILFTANTIGYRSRLKAGTTKRLIFAVQQKFAKQTLLTGNGISAGFSVLVPMDTSSGAALLARSAKTMREERCAN